MRGGTTRLQHCMADPCLNGVLARLWDCWTRAGGPTDAQAGKQSARPAARPTRRLGSNLPGEPAGRTASPTDAQAGKQAARRAGWLDGQPSSPHNDRRNSGPTL